MKSNKSSSPLRILLVEDELHDRLAFRLAFEKSRIPCEIAEYVRAEEALKRLCTDASSFDLVAIDNALPGMSGLELCKELLSQKIPLPLVIITGHGSEQLAVEALSDGVDNYIVKDSAQHYLDLMPVVLPGVVRKYGEHKARKRAEEALRKAHDELEKRVEERTAELAMTTEQLKMELSERKRAEGALRESEERYHMVLEASPDPVVAYDIEGKCTYINPAFTRVFGWLPDELLGRSLDYVPDENLPERQMIIDKVMAGESFSRVDSRRYTKDGRILEVSISASTHLNRAGIPVGSVHTLRDITERKRTEEALERAREELELRVNERTAELTIANQRLMRQIEERKRAEKELKASEEKYRLLFNNNPDPLFMVDIESVKIVDVNEPASGVYQYDRKELLGKSFFDLFDSEDSDRLREELRRFHKDEYVFIDKLWAKRKDGDLFFINFHARFGRFKEPESGAFGPFYIIRTVDITQRLEREAQLTQASKMATLGEMSTGIAHELNQPLNVMRVGGDVLAKMIKRGQRISDEQLMKVSRNITEQVDRASGMISHLREFGRKSGFKLYLVDLNEPIQDVFTIMGQHLKLRNIEVDLKLNEKLPKIMSDKNRLEQIFLNLVTNARDAMKTRGPDEVKKLTVSTYQEGDRVVAEVSDTGTGMPERIRKKIFEPFFTTKEAGKGTGLGLSITYNLVKDFKGDLDVESTPDAGTTFRVRFSAYQEKGADAGSVPVQ